MTGYIDSGMVYGKPVELSLAVSRYGQLSDRLEWRGWTSLTLSLRDGIILT